MVSQPLIFAKRIAESWMDGGLSVQCGIRDSLSPLQEPPGWMSYRDGNDHLPQSSRVGKNAGKSQHLLCLDGRCLSSTSRLCAFPCSVHPALGKRCAPCLRASSASCLQSPATIYPHLQAASSICSSATLPSYSRRCEIGGSLHHPPRFSFSSPQPNHPGRNC